MKVLGHTLLQFLREEPVEPSGLREPGQQADGTPTLKGVQQKSAALPQAHARQQQQPTQLATPVQQEPLTCSRCR